MIPLVVLVATTLVLRAVGAFGVDSLDGWQPAVRGGLAAMLLITAGAHFGSRRRDLIAMVPPRLPRPDLLVTLTGVLELALAVGLVFSATAPVAAVLLVGLLAALFPANVHAAKARVGIGGRPPTPLGPRAVMQLVFAAAALAVVVAA